MSKESERIYLEGRMQALFKSAYPTVKIGFENTNFKEPEEEVYGSFYILGGKGVPVGGSGGQTLTKRTPGIVQVTFWAPDETGTKAATIMTDKVAAIFELHRGRTNDGDVITFKVAEYPKMGKVNGWQPVIVKIPFYRDERIPIPNGSV